MAVELVQWGICDSIPIPFSRSRPKYKAPKEKKKKRIEINACRAHDLNKPVEEVFGVHMLQSYLGTTWYGFSENVVRCTIDVNMLD